MGEDRKSDTTYKAKQRNVSVYVGRRGEWLDRALTIACRHQGWAESRFLRELLLERLARWGMYDPETGKPVMESIEKYENAVPATKSLPDVIDLSEFRKDGSNVKR